MADSRTGPVLLRWAASTSRLWARTGLTRLGWGVSTSHLWATTGSVLMMGVTTTVGVRLRAMTGLMGRRVVYTPAVAVRLRGRMGPMAEHQHQNPDG